MPVIISPADANRYQIAFQGGTDKEFADFNAMLGCTDSKRFEDDKWYCSRVDAQRIYDTMNNIGVGDDLKLKPYGYQRQAIAFCKDRSFGLIQMPCGAGKTPIGLGAFLECRKLVKEKIVGVFVVKVSLKSQWIDEVAKFTDLKVGEIITYKAATHNVEARIKNRRKKYQQLISQGAAGFAKQGGSLTDYAQAISDAKAEIDKLEEEQNYVFENMFDRNKYDIFVVNYESLTDDKVNEALHNMKPEFWYVDEIDYIKSPDAKRSKAMAGFNDAPFRFGATATPIRKNPLDLYGIFSFINPALFPSRRAFEDRYTKKMYHSNRIIGSKNEEELAKEVEPFIFKRSMDEIADQLPKQLVCQIACHFTEKQQAMWNAIYREMDELNEKAQALANRFTAAQLAQNAEYQKLQAQIAARQTFAQMQADTEELLYLSDSKMAKGYITQKNADGVKKKFEAPKVALCMAILDKILASGEKCVIFSKYRDMQDILQREIAADKNLAGIKVNCIVGGISAEKRKQELDEYNNNPDHRILLLSDSGEAGLNLSSTKYMIEFDLADSAAKQTQRHGRIQRADSIHSKVFVYQLIMKDSYDDTIALRSIMKKAGYAKRIL